MNEHPILFSAPMVRAILEGRKTVTRRVMKPQPPPWVEELGYTFFAPDGHISGRGIYDDQPAEMFFKRPAAYQKGCMLWVREAFQLLRAYDHLPPSKFDPDSPILWPADGAIRYDDYPGLRWALGAGRQRPSIHMPRWASRLKLSVTAVRAERLQDITEEGAMDEGLWDGTTYVGDPLDPEPHKRLFAELWNEINAKRGYTWDSNPWVWVVNFRR